MSSNLQKFHDGQLIDCNIVGYGLDSLCVLNVKEQQARSLLNGLRACWVTDVLVSLTGCGPDPPHPLFVWGS